MGIRLLILGLTFTAWFAGAIPSRAETVPPVAPPIMAVLYLEAQRVGTVEGWNAFLEICAGSPYCKLAEAERAKLAGLPKKPGVEQPPVVEIPDPKPEPVAEAPEPEPPPVAAQSVPAAETLPPAETALPAVVPTPRPRPKPQLAQPAVKPKARAQAQPQPPSEPEYTGSIPAPTSLPGTHPRRVQPIAQQASPTAPEEREFRAAQTSGPKPKSGGGAKSAKDRKREMFRHLRTTD